MHFILEFQWSIFEGRIAVANEIVGSLFPTIIIATVDKTSEKKIVQ